MKNHTLYLQYKSTHTTARMSIIVSNFFPCSKKELKRLLQIIDLECNTTPTAKKEELLLLLQDCIEQNYENQLVLNETNDYIVLALNHITSTKGIGVINHLQMTKSQLEKQIKLEIQSKNRIENNMLFIKDYQESRH